MAGGLEVPTASTDEPHIVWRLNVRAARRPDELPHVAILAAASMTTVTDLTHPMCRDDAVWQFLRVLDAACLLTRVART